MTRRLTPAERLAATNKNITLTVLARRSEWDQHLVEQAIFLHAQTDEFSCNDLRDFLPDAGHAYIGPAINALRAAGIIAHTGRMVPSTSGPTHGHRIAVWTLTAKGRAIAARRRAAQQGRAA